RIEVAPDYSIILAQAFLRTFADRWLSAVSAVYDRVGTVVAWLPVRVRSSQRSRGKGDGQDEGKGDSHGEPPIAPRHKTVVKVSLGLYRWPNKRACQKARRLFSSRRPQAFESCSARASPDARLRRARYILRQCAANTLHESRAVRATVSRGSNPTISASFAR